MTRVRFFIRSSFDLRLYELDEKRRGLEVVHRYREESLDLLLVQIHHDELGHARLFEEAREQLTRDGPPAHEFACDDKERDGSVISCTYGFLDVLDEEGGGADVVDGAVEETETLL